MKEVAKFTNLEKLLLPESITGNGLRNLAPLRKLRTIGVRKVTDDTLIALSEIKLLHAWSEARTCCLGRPSSPACVARVSLNGTHVTGKALRELSQFENLQHLDVSRINLTAEHVPELARFKNLRVLCASGTMNGASLSHFPRLKNLEELSLDGCKVSAAGIKAIANLTALKSLSVIRTNIDDEGIEKIASLENLQSIYLSRTRITDEGLKHLASLTNLTLLSLPEQITHVGLRALAPLHKLNDLTLVKHSDITFATLRQIGLLHALSWSRSEIATKRPQSPDQVTGFSIHGRSLTHDAVKKLVVFTNLRCLKISNEDIITSRMLHALREHNLLLKLSLLQGSSPKGMQGDCAARPRSPLDVTYVDFSGIGLTNDDLELLAPFKNIKVLDIRNNHLTNSGLKHLAQFKYLKELRWHGSGFSNGGIRQMLPQVKSLSVNLD